MENKEKLSRNWTLDDEKKFIDGLGEHRERNRNKTASMNRIEAAEFYKSMLTQYIQANQNRKDLPWIGKALEYARQKLEGQHENL